MHTHTLFACTQSTTLYTTVEMESITSPLRHLFPHLLDLIIWDCICQMRQMEQLLHFWRGIVLQKSGQPPSPPRHHPPVLLLQLDGGSLFTNTRQELLEEVLAKDQTVPAAGLNR